MSTSISEIGQGFGSSNGQRKPRTDVWKNVREDVLISHAIAAKDKSFAGLKKMIVDKFGLDAEHQSKLTEDVLATKLQSMRNKYKLVADATPDEGNEAQVSAVKIAKIIVDKLPTLRGGNGQRQPAATVLAGLANDPTIAALIAKK